MIELDLRRLRFLREVEERGTLAAVAAALGYSPSTVSQQLALLEKEVGARLLDKAGRGVRLTDAGRLLAQRVRVEIFELELEQSLPGLRLGTVDLVIGDEYDSHPRPRPAGVRFTILLEEPLKIVLPAAHPLARPGGPVAITDLRSDIWTASAEGTGHHAMVVGTCRALGGYEPDLRHRSSDADVQLELVRAATAVALMPALTLPDGDPALAIRDIAETALKRRLVAATRDTPPAPPLTALLTAVTDLAMGWARR